MKSLGPQQKKKQRSVGRLSNPRYLDFFVENLPSVDKGKTYRPWKEIPIMKTS